jgi:protein involved in ribonucleotide reduction
MKDVAGYDTKRLFIGGSHDAFGTISTAIFKITVDRHNEARCAGIIAGGTVSAT